MLQQQQQPCAGIIYDHPPIVGPNQSSWKKNSNSKAWSGESED